MPGDLTRKIGSKGKSALSALLLAVFASLQLLAAVPALHAFVHKDANSPNHECGVTLFLHGQVDSSTVAVAVVLPIPSLVVREVISLGPLVFRDTPLSSSRGPPFLS